MLAAALTWGTTGTAFKLLAVQSGADALTVAALRLLVAAPLLLAFAAATEHSRPGRSRGALAAGACVAAYQVCYFAAIPLAGVAATALLAICSAPLMIALLAGLFLGERLTARVLLALVVGVGGTVLLVAGSGRLAGPAFAAGAALALGSGASYALYVVLTKTALAGRPPLTLTAFTFTVAAPLLLPALAWRRPDLATLHAGWPLLLYLGAVPTALAYVLYTHGLRRTPATVASLIGLAEPLTAALLGVLLFGEPLGVAGVLGGALLLLALGVLSLPQRGRRAATPVQA